MSTTIQKKSRALPIALGAVLAAIGTMFVLAGAAVLAITGDDGTVGSGSHSLSTPTTALVTEAADLDGANDLASLVGDSKVKLSATATGSGRDVFVGIGPKADVERYLAGSATDEVTDFDVDPSHLTKKRHDGAGTPAAPAAQSFWVARGDGHTAEADWKVEDGDYRVVVMNADGSRGVSTDGHVEVGAEHLSTIALATLLAGIVAITGGIAAMVGRR